MGGLRSRPENFKKHYTLSKNLTRPPPVPKPPQIPSSNFFFNEKKKKRGLKRHILLHNLPFFHFMLFFLFCFILFIFNFLFFSQYFYNKSLRYSHATHFDGYRGVSCADESGASDAETVPRVPLL